MVDVLCRTLDDSFSWATSLSRTRLSSIDGLSLHTNEATAAIGDLQGVLQTIEKLRLPKIPHNALKEIDQLGEGETFTVTKNQWSDQVVAVKLLKHNVLEDKSSRHALRRQMQSVLREILIMHHPPLAAHPNIISLHGYGWQRSEAKHLPYIVVECGTAGSLRQFLKAHPSWSIKNKAILAGDIAAGVMALHEAGIVHGDLKLDNIVVSHTYSRPCMSLAKLCDFGHSISLVTTEHSSYYYGTPLYLPPEALDQKDAPIPLEDLPRCDMWAFGLALWEILLDGKPYFEDKWRCDPKLARYLNSTDSSSTIDKLSIGTTLQDTAETPSTLQASQIADAYFGQFDQGHLQSLSQVMLKRNYPASTFQRSYIGPLLRRALEPNPSKRLANFAGSPIMNEWRSAAPQSALQAKLALHTRTSGLEFTMFIPDRQADIPWGHQTYIVADLEAIVQGFGKEIASSAFQLVICYAVGFGCDVDFERAHLYLMQAVELGSAAAILFSDNLASVFSQSPEAEPSLFAAKVAEAISHQRCIDKTSTLHLTKKPHSNAPHQMTRLSATTFEGYEEVFRAATNVSKDADDVVRSKTFLFNDVQNLHFSWLEFAILSGDYAGLQSCCQAMSIGQLSDPYNWGETPLILACQKGESQMVECLVRHGADPTRCAEDGGTILHWLFCLQASASRIFDLLMKLCPQLKSEINSTCHSIHKIHPQWPTELTGTPLAFSVVAGDRSMVLKLLSIGADPVYHIELPGSVGGQTMAWTPLHLAVKYNHSSIVKDLCLAAASMPSQIKKSVSPLHFAHFQLSAALSFLTPIERYGIHGILSYRRLQETIRALGAPALYWQSDKGTNSLWQAMDFENVEVLKALLEAAPRLAETELIDPSNPSSKMLPIHYTSQISGRRNSHAALDIPKAIFGAYKKGLHICDNLGRTALHFAVSSTFSNVTAWLISNGSQVNRRDNYDRSPLMLSRSIHNTKVLLENGANINQSDAEGLKSVHFFAFRDDAASLCLLMNEGVDTTSLTHQKQTPLHFAVAGSSKSCVAELCRASLPINSVDSNGNTALHLAVELLRSDIIRILLQSAADINIKNNEGKTPVTLAMHQVSVARILTADYPDSFESYQILDLLLVTGIRRDGDDKAREIFLDSAVRFSIYTGDPDLVGFVLFHQLLGPHIKALFKNNRCADLLHHAAKHVMTWVAHQLIGHGMAANTLDLAGNTPLMTLCLSSNSRKPSFEKSENAKSNRLNVDQGDDAFDSAAIAALQEEARTRKQLILLLLRPPFDPFARNHQGQTAWDVAFKHRDFVIMTELLRHVNSQQAQELGFHTTITEQVMQQAIRTGHATFVRTYFDQHWNIIPFLKTRQYKEGATAALQDFYHADKQDPHCALPITDSLPTNLGGVDLAILIVRLFDRNELDRVLLLLRQEWSDEPSSIQQPSEPNEKDTSSKLPLWKKAFNRRDPVTNVNVTAELAPLPSNPLPSSDDPNFWVLPSIKQIASDTDVHAVEE